MARIRQTISIDDKIAKAQETVGKYKDRYDAAVAELKMLIDKKDTMKKEELLAAIESSNKSYDEILDFIRN